MAKPARFLYEGELVDADELEFEIKQPGTLILQLEDASSLRLVISPLKVLRIRGKYNDLGEPIYHLNWSTALGVSVPAELMKPVARKT